VFVFNPDVAMKATIRPSIVVPQQGEVSYKPVAVLSE
jgi:hypothetical protein